MYLHIGNEKILNEKDIIGIFDIENASVSKLTKEFLAYSQKNGQAVSLTNDLPKSIIVCERTGARRLSFSPLAPATQCKRSRCFS